MSNIKLDLWYNTTSKHHNLMNRTKKTRLSNKNTLTKNNSTGNQVEKLDGVGAGKVMN